MSIRFNRLSVVLFLICLHPASGVFKRVLLTARFNDGGVVKGALQMGMKGPDVWYKWDIRVESSYIKKTCSDECGTVEENGLGWSLRSFWGLMVHSGTAAQCSAQGGVYDPTFACGPDSRFLTVEHGDGIPLTPSILAQYGNMGENMEFDKYENTSCGILQDIDLVGPYKCNPAKDPLSCMMGDLGGKFGSMALVGGKKVKGSFYTFKGETGVDPFPPSYLNYCDGDCEDLMGIPTGNKFASVQITCPCGEKPLVCAKLNLEKVIKDDYEMTKSVGSYSDHKGYANTGSKAYMADDKTYADAGKGKAYMADHKGYANTGSKAYIADDKAYADAGKGKGSYSDHKGYANTGSKAYMADDKAYADAGKGKAYMADHKGYANTGSKAYMADDKGYANTDSKAYMAYDEKAYDGDMHPNRYATYDNHLDRDAAYEKQYQPYPDEYKRSSRRNPSERNSHSQKGGGNNWNAYLQQYKQAGETY